MKERSKISKYKNDKNELDLEKIVDEYSAYIYKIIRNTTNEYLSNEDIEEIVTDAFFILWKNQNKLDEEKVLSSYIAGIVRNLIKEKTRIINKNVSILDYENIIQDFLKIDMIYEQREKLCLIEKTVKNMKEEDISIFNLYYYSSMSIKEISKILNITEFSIKSRLYRLRKKLRKELLKGGYSNDE